ncbi:hypothetical protein AX15_007817 [Amanita polypyramis BW_CC]|nr:hypothetical protein AX15_007817 [Amanita polypyramis BW_CC]
MPPQSPQTPPNPAAQARLTQWMIKEIPYPRYHWTTINLNIPKEKCSRGSPAVVFQAGSMQIFTSLSPAMLYLQLYPLLSFSQGPRGYRPFKRGKWLLELGGLEIRPNANTVASL